MFKKGRWRVQGDLAWGPVGCSWTRATLRNCLRATSAIQGQSNPQGFTSLGDHERKKENDFKKRKMVAQQSQEAAAFVKTVSSKVTEQDVVEFRQKIQVEKTKKGKH
jgi:hypothetical protein